MSYSGDKGAEGPSGYDPSKLKTMAQQNTSNFSQWLRGPSGLSATGFGRTTKPPLHTNPELQAMVDAKKRKQ